MKIKKHTIELSEAQSLQISIKVAVKELKFLRDFKLLEDCFYLALSKPNINSNRIWALVRGFLCSLTLHQEGQINYRLETF
jgi:hypothetical protein